MNREKLSKKMFTVVDGINITTNCFFVLDFHDFRNQRRILKITRFPIL